jgi:hypothetical protein
MFGPFSVRSPAHIAIPHSAQLPDPVGDQLKREGLGALVTDPNPAFPWSPLYNPESDAYLYRDGGPLQVFRFADEASSLQRLVFSYPNIHRVRQMAAQLMGLRPGQLPDGDTTVTYMTRVYGEEVPYGDMMTPSLMRGVYRPDFQEMVRDKINREAAKRVATNVSANMESQRIFWHDQATHGTRGVADIPPPAYGGKQHQELYYDRLPTYNGY